MLTARTALAMATRLGAKAVGLQDVDRVARGRQAGRPDPGAHRRPPPDPHYDPYSLLVYATKACDVDTVIIDGEVVMAAGRVLTVNEAAVREKVAAYQQRIAAANREPRK